MLLLLGVGVVGAWADNTLGRPYGFKAAVASTKKAEKGTSTNVNQTRRPAAKGKHVFVISAGQSSVSSQIPANAAMQAIKELGWKGTLLDGKLNPSSYGGLVGQAVAQGADGIVLDAVDCKAAPQQLRQAVARHIKIVSIYAFDCNDPVGGNGGKALFSTCVNYANLRCSNLSDFTKSYGRDQANYIISSSKNKARILLVNDPEFTVLKYTASGFADQIKHSGGSRIVSTLNFQVSDIGKLRQLVQTALLQHPEVNWIKSPYTFATLIGVAPAVRNHNAIKVMGGEGFSDELNLLRNNNIQAVNIISSDWTAWAAVDALNSAFTGKRTFPSGIGWTIADKSHNVPRSGPFFPRIPFRVQYRRAWGR